MNSKKREPLKIIVLVDEDLVPPTYSKRASLNAEWQVERDVIATLREIGHNVRPVGVDNDLAVVTKIIDDFKPDIAFNLLGDFDRQPLSDQHIVSFLELLKHAYTGCNPRGLTLSSDKALTKKILAYHDIPVPRFETYPIGVTVRRPNFLTFPLLVKSSIDEGSVSVSQASIVHDEEALQRRVEFVHKRIGSPAIAEQYIEGRELYMGVLGNEKLRTFPAWELVIENLPQGAPNIATEKVKWCKSYQKKAGVVTRAAELPDGIAKHMELLSKKIYRVLGLSGYARLDYRLTADGTVYLLEANPNPNIGEDEDFAESAKHIGISYPELLQAIINRGLAYRKSRPTGI